MIIYDKNDKYLVIPTGLGNLNTGVATDGDIDPCEGLYEDGYEDGYDTGFSEGKTEGTAEGYQNGYNTGTAEGYQNGYQTGDAEGFERGKTEGVAEYESSLNQLNVTENGTYRGVFKNAYVNVPTMTSGGKKYMDGTIDVDGLRVIGWNDESIQMLQDNTNFYSWQNYNWKVKYSDKDLYGVINANNRDNYKGDASPVFCPYFDTSNLTDLSWFFNSYTNTKGFPKFITSSVTNMRYLFQNCSSLTTIPEIDCSSVTNMQSMFSGCSSLIAIPQLDCSSVTNMRGLFDQCSKLTTIPQLITSKVETMESLFESCKSLVTIPEIDCSSVTNMNKMLYGCRALQSLPRLNCSNVTAMSSFLGSGPFNSPENLTELGGFVGLKTSLDLSYINTLTGESIVNVMNYLSTTPNAGAVLRLPSNARTKYDEVKSEGSFNSAVESLTSIGWTISL